jgi:catechol 2,3-dioxygenase-like lactoylglutathione lyase family enzyme
VGRRICSVARMAHDIQIVIACRDPARMASFWADALGYVVQPPPEGFDSWEDFADSVGIPRDKRNDINAVVDPEGKGPRLLFERWDAGEPTKRVHIDVNSVGNLELGEDESRRRFVEERERLEALGASFHRMASGMAGETWMEMFDVEGNWFCVQ